MSCKDCNCQCNSCVQLRWNTFPDEYSVEVSGISASGDAIWTFSNGFGFRYDTGSLVNGFNGTYILQRLPQNAGNPNLVIYQFRQDVLVPQMCNPPNCSVSPGPGFIAPPNPSGCTHVEESLSLGIDTCQGIGFGITVVVISDSFLFTGGSPFTGFCSVKGGASPDISYFIPLSVPIDPEEDLIFVGGDVGGPGVRNGGLTTAPTTMTLTPIF